MMEASRPVFIVLPCHASRRRVGRSPTQNGNKPRIIVAGYIREKRGRPPSSDLWFLIDPVFLRLRGDWTCLWILSVGCRFYQGRPDACSVPGPTQWGLSHGQSPILWHGGSETRINSAVARPRSEGRRRRGT